MKSTNHIIPSFSLFAPIHNRARGERGRELEIAGERENTRKGERSKEK